MKLPAYRKHSTGKAFAYWKGKRYYFAGKFGEEDSREAYFAFVRAHVLSTPPPVVEPSPRLLLCEALDAYLEYAARRYDCTKSNSEYKHCRAVMVPLMQKFGTLAVADFGPRRLKEFRANLVEAGWSRDYINHQVQRIWRAFKWLVSEQLIDVTVHQALRCVEGLRWGETTADERQEVQPVAWADVAATLPYLTPTVATMVRVQWLTGMRPAEVCAMRMAMIDRTVQPWAYAMSQHKTRWRGKGKRLIFLGPLSQELLKPYLGRGADEPLFSPRQAMEEKRAMRAAARQTKAYGQASKQIPRVSRRVGKSYNSRSYYHAIAFALRLAKAAGVEVLRWHPNQIRHTKGTAIREFYGVEGAQAVLGHATIQATQIYAKSQLDKARAIATETG